MSTVLIDSMDTALARHLLALVREDPAVERIVDSGFPSGASIDDGAGTGAVDVVLTAPGAGPDRDGSRLGGVDTDGAARLLERLDHLPIRSLVVVSSAMVYGAWPANPVPISEDAALSPQAECLSCAGSGGRAKSLARGPDAAGCPATGERCDCFSDCWGRGSSESL